MKTFTLYVLALASAFNVSAQMPQNVKNHFRNMEPRTASLVGEKPHYEARPVVQGQNQSQTARTSTEIQIGTTTYDLMTNGSMLEHIVRHENGGISTAWTFSAVNNWSTRGTGYNYFNGSTWGSAPTSQLESVRTGWPTVGATAGGREIVIAHDNTSIEPRMTSRNSVGSGTWTQAGLGSTLDNDWWHKFAVGGPDGNTIHLIGITQIGAFSGTPYNGLDGALLYARSTDQGATWDITNLQLPGLDSTTNVGFDPDTYAIDAEGDVVAIVVCGVGTGVRLFKSTNNGLSWIKTDVLVPAVQKFDEGTHYIPATFDSAMFSSDGGADVLIDDDGMCHVAFGETYIANDVPGDGSFQYWISNGIDYWNEDFNGANPIWLLGALDLDGDGVIDNQTFDIAQYRFSGLASLPTLGKDENGCIYMSYMGHVETLNNGSQFYRHSYLTRSCDGGCSWSYPKDIKGGVNNAFSEVNQPGLARRVDSSAHVIVLVDDEPGMMVNGDEDPVGENDIYCIGTDIDELDSGYFCPLEMVGDTLMCPGTSASLWVNGCADTYAWTGPSSFSGSTQTVSVSNLGTYQCVVTNTCGTDTVNITLIAPSSGSNPTLITTSSPAQICSGDTSVLSVTSNVSGSTYTWSTGSTTSTTSVTSAGTYSVTVTTCTGQSTATVVISEPGDAPSAQVLGMNSLCSGSSTTLFAPAMSGGTYSWSTGSNAQSISVSAAGTYSVTMTNCGGSSSGSKTISQTAAPVASISPNPADTCEGDPLVISASGGDSYVWSNGSTSSSITVSELADAGTYTVTVFNSCGDEDTASVVVNINSAPPAPTISFDGVQYMSSSGTTYQWYLNGALVPGATAQVYVGSLPVGGLLVVQITDASGCSSESAAFVIAMGIGEISGQEISLYPNPNNGTFVVEGSHLDQISNVIIEDLLGRPQQFDWSRSANRISIGFHPSKAGVFTVRMLGDNVALRSRIIVE